MYLMKAFLLAAAAAMVSGTRVTGSTEGGLNRRDNCGGLGDCYSNGCNPRFDHPVETTGKCTAGEYNGCPCEKCGGGWGYEGRCNENGCNGYSGKCTAGKYDGCDCK